ncbi:MAG: site-specific DNA-methyltransferase [Pirellulaceae bacterium]
MESPDPTTQSHRNTVLCGDALNVLPTLPRETVDCLVTSPPYYRQRDYQGDSQVGQESSPQEYVDRLVEIFAAAAPVLKPTGSLWLVLGDKYQNGRLLGMPWRVALALQDAGWWLRSDCIWHKPNAMPSSVKTRPTIDHEYIFFFSRQKEYYYDANAIREPHVTFSEKSRMKGGRNHFHKRGGTPETGKNGGQSNLHDGRWDQAFHPEGRNKRTVWSISLSKFREAHFAVFPQSLAETCIKATSQPGGLVLDPFLGSGTTAVAAQALGRDYLGIDQSAEYCEIARRRIANPTYHPANQPP